MTIYHQIQKKKMLANAKGIEPKELVLQDYDDFKDSMCNVPLHVVKIRYRHHKKCVKDLLTIVSDDMKANESREVMVQLAEKIVSYKRIASKKALPKFLRDSEENAQENLNLTMEDLEALQKKLGGFEEGRRRIT